MSEREVLQSFRECTMEVDLLDQQLKAAADSTGMPHTAAALAAMKRKRQELLPQFEEVVRRAGSARLRVILRQYYGSHATDAQIAAAIGCTAKAVNKLRNGFMKREE